MNEISQVYFGLLFGVNDGVIEDEGRAPDGSVQFILPQLVPLPVPPQKNGWRLLGRLTSLGADRILQCWPAAVV